MKTRNVFATITVTMALLAVFGLCLGPAFAVDQTQPLNVKSTLNIDKGGIFQIDGTAVTVTAAQVNGIADGSISLLASNKFFQGGAAGTPVQVTLSGGISTATGGVVSVVLVPWSAITNALTNVVGDITILPSGAATAGGAAVVHMTNFDGTVTNVFHFTNGLYRGKSTI